MQADGRFPTDHFCPSQTYKCDPLLRAMDSEAAICVGMLMFVDVFVRGWCTLVHCTCIVCMPPSQYSHNNPFD